jgi:hypothetical protein
MVLDERSCQKEYTWNMKALPPTNQKLGPQFKFL